MHGITGIAVDFVKSEQTKLDWTVFYTKHDLLLGHLNSLFADGEAALLLVLRSPSRMFPEHQEKQKHL